MNELNNIWCISGDDPLGFSGIQQDVSVVKALGLKPIQIRTANTSQDSNQVKRVEFLEEQVSLTLNELLKSAPPAAIKIGMLGTVRLVEIVLEAISKLSVPVVFDPIIWASSGDWLIDKDEIDRYRAIVIKSLLPAVTLVTPNIPEAKFFADSSSADSTPEQLLQQLVKLGARNVLLKGGHAQSVLVVDLLSEGESCVALRAPRRLVARTRGTGCVLSSAIAAALALKYSLRDAAVLGKAYLTRALRTSVEEDGVSRLLHAPWPVEAQDLPELVPNIDDKQIVLPAFESHLPQSLGLYPIVARANLVEKLAGVVHTVQLRVKDLSATALANEVKAAIYIASQYKLNLYINDHWELAIQYGAYGVHLGQQDLERADLCRIQQAGLRLGVSTHSLSELAYAKSLRPSYIAYGPIFSTRSKETGFLPQGVERLRIWRKLVNIPLVAIGGIIAENAAQVLAAGVDGIAVLGDLVNTDNLVDRIAMYPHKIANKASNI